MSFLPLALQTDPDVLTQEAVDYMTDAYGEEWKAAAASFVRRFFGANALWASVNRDTAVIVATEIFKYLGGLYGLPPIAQTFATGVATVTMRDTAGYRVEQGRNFSIAATGDERFVFAAQDTLTVPVGETTGQVTLVAVEPGTRPNGLTARPVPLDSIPGIESVALDDPVGGGVDAEGVEPYLMRLRELFQLQAPRPILPHEFATLARTVPTVHRTLAIDGYNPADRTAGNTRMVTVWNIQADGTPVLSAAADLVAALLAARREATFRVNVEETPDYTTVDVEAEGVALPGWDPEAVGAHARDVLTSVLSPATWGATSRGRDWRLVNVVRAGQLESAVLRVQGLDFLDSLTISGGSPNLALRGVAPLPRPGDIRVTVNSP